MLCNGKGNLLGNSTVCICNSGYVGTNCQYSRNTTCKGKGDPKGYGKCVMDCESKLTTDTCCHADGNPSCNTHWKCPDSANGEYQWRYSSMNDCSGGGCFPGYSCKQGNCIRPLQLSANNYWRYSGNKCSYNADSQSTIGSTCM